MKQGHLTCPVNTRKYMENYHEHFGREFPWGLAFAQDVGIPWEDVPYHAFMLKPRNPTEHEMQWAKGVVEVARREILLRSQAG